MRKKLWAAVLGVGLGLASCGPSNRGSEQPEAGAPRIGSPDPTGAPAERSAYRWTEQITGAGVAVALSRSDLPILSLSCERDPARMSVVLEDFRAIGSEERLSFGLDGEPFVFVADPAEPRPGGVRGEAPIEAELLDRLQGAREIAAVYGAQTAGPYPAPEDAIRQRFVGLCRQIAARAP